MKVLLSYSGGKDSQASLLWAVKKFGAKNIEAVFSDTKWENPITYEHIINTTADLGVKQITVKSKKYNGMIDLAIKRQRFPSTKARFCTEELKSIPMIDYVLAQTEHLIIINGIRAQESTDRSKMKAQCRYFKFYFQPYKSNEITINSYQFIKNPTSKQKQAYTKAKNRLSKGFKDEKYFTHRKKEVIEWVKKYNDDLFRPVFDWTGQQVIDYIIENGQQPNPLYKQGFKRVGCFPCIMSGHQEVFQILTHYPERFDEIISLENELGSSFFKNDFVPPYARTGVCPRSGKLFSKAIDVKTYLLRKNATLDMFQPDEPLSCSSYYNLCE